MFRIETQQLKLSADMSADFVSGEWDVRGISAGLIEIAWSGMVNAGATASVSLEATGTRACWCSLSGMSVDILPADTCSGLELREGHGYSYIRAVYSHGAASAGSMSIVATGKVLMDNGISGGNL